MGKFYAVVVGRNPGIYLTWDETKAMVDGYKGAIYKSFNNRHDAEAYISNSTYRTSTTPDVGTVIWTDGSFTKDVTGTYAGYGVIIPKLRQATERKVVIYGCLPSGVKCTSATAELYAIYVALSSVPGNLTIYTDSIYSLGELTTNVHVYARQGWNSVTNVEFIKPMYELMRGRDILFKHVSAHVGIPYNEEVDSLAKRGARGASPYIVE